MGKRPCNSNISPTDRIYFFVLNREINFFQKAHSLENNIIINGLDEKQPEKMNKEKLAKILQNISEKEMELYKVTVEHLQINSLYRMGESD